MPEIVLKRIVFQPFFYKQFKWRIKKVYDIKKHTGNYHLGISSIFFDKFLNMFALISIAFFFSIFFMEENILYKKIFLLFSLLFCACMLFFLYIFSPKVHKFGLLAIKKIKFLNSKMQILHTNFYTFKDHKLLIKTIFISIFTQILRIYAIYLIALFLNVKIAFFYYIFFIPIITLITTIPISIGGFGPRELSSQMLFAQVGVNALNSLLFQLFNYAFFALISLSGLYYFLKEKKDK